MIDLKKHQSNLYAITAESMARIQKQINQLQSQLNVCQLTLNDLTDEIVEAAGEDSKKTWQCTNDFKQLVLSEAKNDD